MKWVLMKAVYIREHGLVADLKVSEVPTPSTGPGEVLVKVEAEESTQAKETQRLPRIGFASIKSRLLCAGTEPGCCLILGGANGTQIRL